MRGEADLVLDTSALNVHELRAKMRAPSPASGPAEGLRVSVVSFGYKYGLPVDADLVVDCRFLPNPHWVAGAAPADRAGRRGQGVRAQPAGRRGVPRRLPHGAAADPGRLRARGQAYVTLAVGCTGGKHRSVAIAEQIAGRLAETGSASRWSTGTWGASDTGSGARSAGRRGPGAG